jgi:hypothetical protein
MDPRLVSTGRSVGTPSSRFGQNQPQGNLPQQDSRLVSSDINRANSVGNVSQVG